MPDNTLRWRLSRHVRRALVASVHGSAVQQAYRVARRIPGVRQIWRLVDRDARMPWSDITYYASAGGVFGANRAPADQGFPTPVAFGDDRLFANLISRIQACEPPLDQPGDTVVLVNNGLSAGGAERQIINTLAGLKARGQAAVLVAERMSGIPGQDFHLAAARAAGIDVRQLENVTEPGPRLFEAVSRPVAEQLVRMPPEFILEIQDMVRMLRGIRPRVLHLWQDETSLKHAISGLIAGVPKIILSGRNVNPTHFVYHQPYMRAAYQALLAAPQVTLSNNSQTGADSYAQWLGIDAGLVAVVRNGLAFAGWPAPNTDTRIAARAELGVSSGGRLVLGVFRLAAEKRPLLWVEVAAEALKAMPDLRFAIAGEGPMSRTVRDRIGQLGIGKSVRLLGRRSDVAALLMAADAFLLTSEKEGIPNVLLEAQWYGRPIVATPAGGAAEALLDEITGRIANSSEPRGIARELVAVLNDPEFRGRCAVEGPSFVRRTFGLEQMVGRTVDLYGAAVGGRRDS